MQLLAIFWNFRPQMPHLLKVFLHVPPFLVLDSDETSMKSRPKMMQSQPGNKTDEDMDDMKICLQKTELDNCLVNCNNSEVLKSKWVILFFL